MNRQGQMHPMCTQNLKEDGADSVLSFFIGIEVLIPFWYLQLLKVHPIFCLRKRKNDMRLDCETKDTTITSLETIYNVVGNDLVEFLEGFDLERFYENTSLGIPADRFLFQNFEESFGPPHKKFQRYVGFT